MYTQRLNILLRSAYPATSRRLGTIIVEQEKSEIEIDESPNYHEYYLVWLTTDNVDKYAWETILYRVESEVLPIIALVRTEDLREKLEEKFGRRNGISITVTPVLMGLNGEELGDI